MAKTVLPKTVLDELKRLGELPKGVTKKARKIQVLTRAGYGINEARDILKELGEIK